MDGHRGLYAKWDKSYRKIKIPHDFSCIWGFEKTTTWKQTNKQKANLTQRIKEQIDGCQKAGVEGCLKNVRGNTVNNSVTTLLSDRWLLELVW